MEVMAKMKNQPSEVKKYAVVNYSQAKNKKNSSKYVDTGSQSSKGQNNLIDAKSNLNVEVF